MVSRAMAMLALSEEAVGKEREGSLPTRLAASSESAEKPKPSRCGARYHNGYSVQTCLLAKGHEGRHYGGEW
jgi:hypothetical protein